jgi:hypothetical protein
LLLTIDKPTPENKDLLERAMDEVEKDDEKLKTATLARMNEENEIKIDARVLDSIDNKIRGIKTTFKVSDAKDLTEDEKIIAVNPNQLNTISNVELLQMEKAALRKKFCIDNLTDLIQVKAKHAQKHPVLKQIGALEALEEVLKIKRFAISNITFSQEVKDELIKNVEKLIYFENNASKHKGRITEKYTKELKAMDALCGLKAWVIAKYNIFGKIFDVANDVFIVDVLEDGKKIRREKAEAEREAIEGLMEETMEETDKYLFLD